MDEKTILWRGESGKEYNYWVHDMNTTFKDVSGNYIFAKETSPGNWDPIYIGQTDSLKRRLLNHEKLPCIKRHGSSQREMFETFKTLISSNTRHLLS